MKIAILGCGAMGGIYAARFAQAGHTVWAIDLWEAHISTIQSHGLRVDGPDGPLISTPRASTTLSEAPACDLYVIATKASGVGPAAEQILKHGTPEAPVLTIQNGLGAEERLAAHLPRNRILLGVAEGFGAAVVGPGHIRHAAMKQIRLGEPAGGLTDRLQDLVDLWQGAGFTAKAFPDIAQLIWEKFICNVTLSGPCTMFDCTVAQLRADPARWAVALGCAQEAYACGKALDIAFTFADPVPYVTDFANRLGEASPSMRLDHLAKRPSEIDAINGQVPVIGARLGHETPFNVTVCAAIRAREANF